MFARNEFVEIFIIYDEVLLEIVQKLFLDGYYFLDSSFLLTFPELLVSIMEIVFFDIFVKLDTFS